MTQGRPHRADVILALLEHYGWRPDPRQRGEARVELMLQLEEINQSRDRWKDRARFWRSQADPRRAHEPWDESA